MAQGWFVLARIEVRQHQRSDWRRLQGIGTLEILEGVPKMSLSEHAYTQNSVRLRRITGQFKGVVKMFQSVIETAHRGEGSTEAKPREPEIRLHGDGA